MVLKKLPEGETNWILNLSFQTLSKDLCRAWCFFSFFMGKAVRDLYVRQLPTVVMGSMMALQWPLRHSPDWLDTSACGVRWYFITSCRRGKLSEELRGSRHSVVCVWSAQNMYWELIANANGWWSVPTTHTKQYYNKSKNVKKCQSMSKQVQ